MKTNAERRAEKERIYRAIAKTIKKSVKFLDNEDLRIEVTEHAVLFYDEGVDGLTGTALGAALEVVKKYKNKYENLLWGINMHPIKKFDIIDNESYMFKVPALHIDIECL